MIYFYSWEENEIVRVIYMYLVQESNSAVIIRNCTQFFKHDSEAEASHAKN